VLISQVASCELVLPAKVPMCSHQLLGAVECRPCLAHMCPCWAYTHTCY
jgi:hypothetical protein